MVFFGSFIFVSTNVREETDWKKRCEIIYFSESVTATYPYSVGNTGGADHTVGVQPATGRLVDKGAMTRPLISSQMPSFHPCPPGRPSKPVHILQRRSRRGRRSS